MHEELLHVMLTDDVTKNENPSKFLRHVWYSIFNYLGGFLPKNDVGAWASGAVLVKDWRHRVYPMSALPVQQREGCGMRTLTRGASLTHQHFRSTHVPQPIKRWRTIAAAHRIRVADDMTSLGGYEIHYI